MLKFPKKSSFQILKMDKNKMSNFDFSNELFLRKIKMFYTTYILNINEQILKR